MEDISIYLLTPKQWLEQNWDINPARTFEENLLDALAYYEWQGTAPAMCYHGCEVEPDGFCEHGNPSPFLALSIV
jgi:hypothetical protein